MIINIFGSDTWRSAQYLNQTITQFKQKRDPQGYNVIVLDAQNSNSSLMLNEIKSAPFLADKRLVVLKNVLSSSDKEMLNQLIELVNKNLVPDNNIVVFYQADKLGKVKEVKELDKILKQQKYSQEFSLLKGVQLNTWIKQEITKQGGKISARAISYLANNVGDDSWYLNSLINQLVAYANGKEIQTKTVELFLEEKIDDNVFNMVEAIVGGQTKQAFKLLNEQRRKGESDMKIFGLIVWQFKILLEMRDLFEREDNLDSNQIAKKMGIHPFVAKKNMYLIKRFPLIKLKQLHKQLLDIDHKSKTGQGDQSLLIDLFIGSI